MTTSTHITMHGHMEINHMRAYVVCMYIQYQHALFLTNMKSFSYSKYSYKYKDVE